VLMDSLCSSCSRQAHNTTQAQRKAHCNKYTDRKGRLDPLRDDLPQERNFN